MVEFL